MLLNLFINQMTEKVKKQKVMRSSVYTGDSYWTDLRRRKAQQELAEAAKGMHQLTSFFSVSDFGPRNMESAYLLIITENSKEATISLARPLPIVRFGYTRPWGT
jgi:hypothetical protein